MFENLPFQTLQTETRYTPDVIQTLLNSNDDIEIDGHIWRKWELNHLRDQISKGSPASDKLEDFCVSGIIRDFHIPPMSEDTRNHLFYLKGFSLFEMDSHYFTCRQSFSQYILFYTYSGHGMLEYEGRTYHLNPGDGFFIDGRKPHRYGSLQGSWLFADVSLSGPDLEYLYKQYTKNPSVLFHEPADGLFQTILELVLRLYHTAEPFCDQKISALLYSLLTHLIGLSASSQERGIAATDNMQYLIRYIEHNFTKDLTMDYLARFSGISKAHLSREFKKYTGFSPMDYIIQMRLEHAAQLLGTEKKAISVIAAEAGFHNINNFINLFKKKFGTTPSQYRKSLQHLPPLP